MTWEIKPYISVGPILFGQPRSAIRQVLGGKYDTFEKVPGAVPADAYDHLGVHAYYDKQDRLCLVELFEPASVTFSSLELLNDDIETVTQALQEKGIERLEVDNGYKYNQLGIVLIIVDGQVDGVSVFKEHYYD